MMVPLVVSTQVTVAEVVHRLLSIQRRVVLVVLA